MENLWLIGGSIAAGLIAGAIIAALYFRARLAEARIASEMEKGELRAKVSEAETRLQAERKAAEEKLALLEEARTRLTNEFKALAAAALNSNNESFIALAKGTFERFHEGAKGELSNKERAIAELLKPVRESLEKVDGKIQELEKRREGAYQGLHEQIRMLLETQTQLRSETGNLVKALRSPVARGRWGELQLKRVVEMAGMVEYCDFEQQLTFNGEEGRLRPDLVVRLPGGRTILVDAKTPLDAYLSAMECQEDAQRRLKLADHCRQIRAHIANLGRKAYFEQVSPTPEFVILFLPGESFFSAALQEDPGLIEAGLTEHVLIATPTTLIALLRAVAYGWRQEKLAENAHAISELGRDLYKRLSDMGEHWSRVGKSLGAAVDSYNRAVGSLENRVLVTARKFKELQAAPVNTEIEALPQVEQNPRRLQSFEFNTRDLFDK